MNNVNKSIENDFIYYTENDIFIGVEKLLLEMEEHEVITKERTRFKFNHATNDHRMMLTKLISANGISYAYINDEFAAAPIGVDIFLQKHINTNSIKNMTDTFFNRSKLSYIPPEKNMPTPRDQLQKDALDFLNNQMLEYSQLGLIVPPGIGKSFMGISWAIQQGWKTIIIVPTNNLKSQFYKVLTNMFHIPQQYIADIKNSSQLLKNKDKDWMLCLQTTFSELSKTDELENVFKQLNRGTKIIDEAHLFFRNTLRIDGSANISNNLYMTATFERSSSEESRLFSICMSKVKQFKIDTDALESYGIMKHINILACEVNSYLSKEELANMITLVKIGNKTARTINIGRYMRAVVPDNGYITEYMKQCMTVSKIVREKIIYGKMLVLAPTVNATEIFANILRNIFPNLKIGTINSKNSKSLNDQNKEECDIIVSTVKSTGTGMDIPDLSIVVCTEQYKSPVLSDQVSGRLRTRKDGKDTYYVDITDIRVTQFLIWRDERLKILKRKVKSYQRFKPWK